MQPIDIGPAELETVRRILGEHAPEIEARAFGSRVSWNARETSDLDLVLMTDETLESERLMALRAAFTNSDLPFRIDIVDWATTSESFRKIVEKESIVVASKKCAVDWPKMMLKDFSPLSYGKGLKSDRRNTAGSVPVFGSNGRVGWHDEALTDGPTVIIGRKGTVGSVHYSPVPCWPIDTTFFISETDGELARFKYYVLGTLGLAAMNTDSAVPGLNRNAFHVRETQTPPLSEQRAIARVLGALDDKIEANRRMNATLEAMAQALFKDWFVDFGPTRAKLAGHPPYLPEPLWSLFPDRMIDSELGEIPEGWECHPISDFASIKGGKQLTKDRIQEYGPYPVFGGAGIMGNTDSYNAEGYVISVGRVGAYCGQFFSHRGKAWINNNASLISPNDNTIGEWLLLSLKNLDIELIKKGAAQPFVANSDIASMPIVFPGNDVLICFREIVIDGILRKELILREIEALSTARDTLLPKLISGNLRLHDTARPKEDAA